MNCCFVLFCFVSFRSRQNVVLFLVVAGYFSLVLCFVVVLCFSSFAAKKIEIPGSEKDGSLETVQESVGNDMLTWCSQKFSLAVNPSQNHSWLCVR